MRYSAGTDCIILSSGLPDTYESIAFIEVNEEGLISEINITDDSRYKFQIIS